MTIYSDYLSDDQLSLLLDAVRNNSYLSRRDGCRVVLVRCVKCGKKYDEELEAAIEIIGSREKLLCLDCDDDATAPSFSGITVQIGWQA